MSLDFTGVLDLETTYVVSGGNTIVTFTDLAGPTVLGTLTVETEKHRPLLEALRLFAETFDPANDPDLFKSRSTLDVNSKLATTVFTA